MSTRPSRASRYFFFNDKAYLQMDFRGRITIPPELYVNKEDAYFFCSFTVPEENVILIQYNREKRLRQNSQPNRLCVPLNIREKYKFDSTNLFECTPIKNGFRLKRVKLKGVIE